MTFLDDPVWEFVVAVSTHDLIQRGITEVQHRHVTVAAPSHLKASLLAAQMAAAVDGAMPTKVYTMEDTWEL